MSPPQTKPGTPKLSELARHFVLPTGIVSTGWPAVRDKCLHLGVRFDDWQDSLGRAILAKRADGKYAAGVGGVVISIPRQVGKTYTVGAIVFALCILCPGLTVVWTAHRSRTAGETFRSMQGMAKRAKVAPFVEQVFTGSGDEEIRFRNGSRVLFGARERGFGRGFAEVDVEVFDEAQILTEKALDDMVPATNQSKQPTGALLFFIGTPPKPTDPGEAFAAKRAKAVGGKSTDTLYLELSADPDAKPDDRKQWSKANLSYPRRTPLEAMLRMRENLSDESFLREALGIWAPDAEPGAIPGWEDAADPLSTIADRPVLAVTMAPDSSTVALVAAGRRSDGDLHVEVVLHGRPGRWFTTETAAVAKRQGSRVAVVPSHPAGSMISELEEAGVTVIRQSRVDYLQGCGVLYNAVADGRLHYPPPQPELAAAVANATRKQAEQSWRWSGEGISALVAASQAVFEASKAPVGGSGRLLLA